jgi:hypothetical protein
MGAIVTSLLSLMKIWTKYDIEKRNSQAEGKPEPEKPADGDKGKEVAEAVEAGIKQHENTDDEATALQVFKQNPAMFESALRQALENLAKREPGFAEQLRQLHQQYNAEQTHTHAREMNISDQAQVGMAMQGDVSGDMKVGGISMGDRIEAQKAQGFINRPTGPVSQRFGDRVDDDNDAGKESKRKQ